MDGRAFPLEELAAVLRRVNPDVRFNDAVPERPADATWRVRFRGAVMQHSVFRRLWLGTLASSVGQWMQQVALGWLPIVLTNSPGFVDIVTGSAGLPFLVVAPFGGALIDRVDRRRLMLGCQVLAFLLATVLAIDVISSFVQAWHLPISAFLNGSLLGLLMPTQQSLVPALVPRESLINAVALVSAGQNMTRVVGPSVAGIAIGTIGVGPTFLARAVAIAVSFILVLGIVLPPRAPRAADGRGIFDGIRPVASRPDLRSLFLLASIPTFIVFPYLGFLNVGARDILSIEAGGLGLLMAVSGCGAVVGSLLLASAAISEGAGRLLVSMTVLYGLPIVGVALSRTLWITLPLLFSAEIVADFLGTPVAVAGGAVISSLLAGILGLTSSAVRDV
jgi:MFS family permease